MGHTAYLDLCFRRPLDSVHELIVVLMESGWRLGCGDQIMYLPVGELDYDWAIAPKSLEKRVFEVIRQKDDLREEVGLDMVWMDTSSGGTMRATSGQKELSLSVDIHRRSLSDCDGLTDVSWYIERFVAPLVRKGYHLERMEFADSTIG
jgi:hypothetical protein